MSIWKLAPVLLLLLSGSCMRPGPSAPAGPPLSEAPAVRKLDHARSFAAMGSRVILAAAMKLPAAAAIAEPPPVSLTASDGAGLKLVSLQAQAVVEGPLAFTELHLKFRNPRPAQIEGRFAVTLPVGAVVSRLAMRIDDGWQEAEVVERAMARRAYEDFLHRKQDPALLEKKAGNAFRARIFPIAPSSTKEIILSYSHALSSSTESYRLPLRGLPEIEELSVVARARRAGAAGFETVRLAEHNYTPQRDFELATTTQAKGLRHQDLVMARVAPRFETSPEKLGKIAVLFDTSASRALGFGGSVRRLGNLLGGLRLLHGDDASLVLATFDQAVVSVYEGNLGGLAQAHLDDVRARRPLGASNLHAALSWLAQQGHCDRAVIITDSVATAGIAVGADAAKAAIELQPAMAKLKGRIARLDMVLEGGIVDDAAARRLVLSGLERDGVVLDGQQPPQQLARRISQATKSGVAVQIAGAAWVWPQKLVGVQPGDERLVFAQLEPGALAVGAALSVKLSGGLEQVVNVELDPTQGPLLKRAAVGARIQRLDDRSAKTTSAKKKQQLRGKIVALSRKHRVLSNHTALLVLETGRDYARFKIDRTALSDILTVGAGGVELLQRSQYVLPPDPALLERARQLKRMGDARAAKALVNNPSAARRLKSVPGDPLARYLDDLESEELAKATANCTNCFIRRSPSGQLPAAKPRPAPATSAARSADKDEEDGSYGYEFSDDPLAARGFGPNDAVVRVRPGPTRGRASAGFRPRLRSSGEGRSFPSEAPSWMAEATTAASAYSGRMQDLMLHIDTGRSERAVVEALAWRNEEPGNVMALVGLGEALEAQGATKLAARAYGSIVDLYPSRADMRRFAANRLEHLGPEALALAIDIYARALAERPDHLTAHRLLAMALLRAGGAEQAFEVLERGMSRHYPDGRFQTGKKLMREELGIIAAVWASKQLHKRDSILERLAARGAKLATKPSLRFVLTWETDANDVDLHVFDGHQGHAFYSHPKLGSGGRLWGDVTNGYGPECFSIEGAERAHPYTLAVHYYSRGPMGYGMGKVAIIAHDGAGRVHFDDRPFVVMRDRAHALLGSYSGPD